MNELSLFTGAGGGVLGSKLLGHRIIGYVEYEPCCQEIIKQRISDGILDAAPIFGDIRKFISEGYAESYKGMVDVVTAGFPCQDLSVAGKGGGIEQGEKSSLWFDALKCARIIKPKVGLLVENVPGLLSNNAGRDFGIVLRGLAESGYSARWICLRASDVGGWHERERVWIFAYPTGAGLEGGWKPKINGKRFKGIEKPSLLSPSAIIRKRNDVARYVERITAIGNGQVPLCMAYAFSILSQGIIE